MHRSRAFQAFALLAAIAAVLYLTISLYLPSPRRLILGVGKRDGYVRMVQQHVTFLPPFQFYRLSFERSMRDGSAQRDGVTRINSKDGVSVKVTYRLRFSIAGKRKIGRAA